MEPAEVGGTLLSLGSSVLAYSALGVLTINCTEAIRIPGRAWKEMGTTQGRPCAPVACWRGQTPPTLYPQALLEVPELRMKKRPQEVTEEWIFFVCAFLEIDCQPCFSLPRVRWGGGEQMVSAIGSAFSLSFLKGLPLWFPNSGSLTALAPAGKLS